MLIIIDPRSSFFTHKSILLIFPIFPLLTLSRSHI